MNDVDRCLPATTSRTSRSFRLLIVWSSVGVCIGSRVVLKSPDPLDIFDYEFLDGFLVEQLI